MTDTPAVPAPPTGKTALITFVVLLVVIVGFIMLCGALGLKAPFVGFIFAIYWAGIRHSAWPEFLPALIGGLAGLATAYAASLAPALGTPMLVAVLVLIIAAIYLDLVRWVPMVFNSAFMIFLTLGAAPPITKDGDFAGMALVLLLAAAYFGVIIRAVAWYQGRRNPVTIEI